MDLAVRARKVTTVASGETPVTVDYVFLKKRTAGSSKEVIRADHVSLNLVEATERTVCVTLLEIALIPLVLNPSMAALTLAKEWNVTLELATEDIVGALMEPLNIPYTGDDCSGSVKYVIVSSTVDSSVDFTLTTENVAYTGSTTGQGSTTIFRVNEGAVYFIAGSQVGSSVCGFNGGSDTSVFAIMGSDASTTLVWECFLTTEIRAVLSSTTASEDDVMAYSDEIDAAIAAALANDANGASVSPSDYRYEYDADTSAIVFYFRSDLGLAGGEGGFSTQLVNEVESQPNLSSFFESDSTDVTFTLGNTNSLDSSDLLPILSAVTGFPESSISLSYNSEGNTYTVSSTFTGSTYDIDSVTSMVASGDFATSLESAFSTSSAFSSSTVTMGSVRSVSLSLTGDGVAGNADASEVLTAVSSTVGFSDSALDVTVSSEVGNQVSYNVVFAGESDELDAAMVTLATPVFTQSFAAAMSGTDQGNGATIQWGTVDGGDSFYGYSFALVGVSTMDESELESVIASSLGVASDMVSVETSAVGGTTYSVDATFTGELYEITAVQEQLNAGWTTLDDALSNNSVFSGAEFASTGATSSTTWSFALENFDGSDADIQAAVAAAFGVSASTVSVTTAADGTSTSVSVRFEDTTEAIGLIEIAIRDESYASTLESGISSVDSDATITYISQDSLSFVYVISGIDNAYSSLISSEFATFAGISEDAVSVSTTESGGDRFTYSFTVSGSVAMLSGVESLLTVDEAANFESQIQANSLFSEASVGLEDYDQYLPCVQFLFFFDGLCNGITRELDVVYVIDSSSSFNEAEYAALKNFLALTHNRLLPVGARTAALQFATITQQEWQLSTYGALPSSLIMYNAHIIALQQIKGFTYTDDAITEAISMFDDSSSADRVMILVTDGVPTDGHSPCADSSITDALAAANIETIVYGIGTDFLDLAAQIHNPSADGITCLATDDDHIFFAEDEVTLQQSIATLGAITCPGGSLSDYDGVYNQQSYYLWNDHHVYNHVTTGDIMRFDGVEWFITDSTGTFISTQGGDQGIDVPAASGVWNKYDSDNTLETSYENMLVVGCTQGTTDEPTLLPTAFLSSTPTTTPLVQPTDEPTVLPPTIAPTEQNCDHLEVYRSGICPRNVDVIFVVDSSSTMQGQPYVDMKEYIKFLIQNVTEEYPENSFRFSVSQFSGGSSAQVEFFLDDYTEVADYNAAIDALELLEGATYTREAIEYVMETVVPTSTSYDGETLLMLLTDGAPTNSDTTDQRPCTDTYNAGDLLIAENVLGIVLGVGDIATDTTGVSCVSYNEAVLFTAESYDEVGDALNTLFECQEPTPFDGRYRNTGVVADSGINTIYENYLGYELYVENFGNWIFVRGEGEDREYMVKALQDAADQDYPKDAGEWQFVPVGGNLVTDFITYNPVRIICSDEATPTKTPSNEPSVTPSKRPSNEPTDQPSNEPSQGPTIAPTGLTRTPSVSPLIAPSLTPAQSFVADCATFSVFQGLCQQPNGVDWVFLFDSSDDVTSDVYNAFKTISQTIVTDIIGPEEYSTLGAIKYSGNFVTDFANGDWDSKDEWIEFLRSLLKDDPAMDRDGDLPAAVNEAIYKLYAPVYSPDKDRAMVIFISDTPTEFDCNLWSDLNSRGIYTTVVSIGSGFYLGASCLATSSANYVNFATPQDAVDADIFDYMCDEDMPFTGGYQRVSEELGENNAYTYVNAAGVTLDYENEGWIFTDPNNGRFVSRGGTTPYPPDKFCWDYDNNAGPNSLQCMVRLVCSDTSIPTRSPTKTPSKTPSVEPTSNPTTDQPTSNPSTRPSGAPSVTPTSSPETSIPTTTPSDMPSTTPTTTPSDLPTTDSPTRTPSVQPSGTPSSVPTTDEPTVTPSNLPSKTPSIAPTDDCVHFIVGDCECLPTRYDGPVCGEDPVVSTPYNGGYSRTTRTENGMPIYIHSDNWEFFFDGEVWAARDPKGILSPMAESDGSDFIYPDNMQQYVSLDPFNIYAAVPICCVTTSIPTRNPSDMPTTTPSDIPTGTPTISGPTQQPVVAPSGSPSGTPSSSPFGSPSTTPSGTPSSEPTVSAPSVTPSVAPSTSPSTSPSTPPSVGPTFTQPTTAPSTNPSASPSTSPSESPEYSVPTTSPSNNPTTSPSFSNPTQAPSVMPTPVPTDMPTVKPSHFPTTTPTFAPTDDCHHFFVGLCPCNNGTLIDLVIIMDGSNTIANAAGMFEGVTDYLGTELGEILPEGARLGMMQYGTLPEITLMLNNDDTREEQANTIADMEPIGGATWTRSALISAINTMWLPHLDSGRDKITIIITDGEPSSFQDPCNDATETDNGSIRALYDSYDIDIIPVAIDNEDLEDEAWYETLGCLSRNGRFNYRYFGSGSDYTTLMESVWDTLDICEEQRTTDTPYNGGYSRLTETTYIVDAWYEPLYNGRPVYRHSENYLALWTGETWMFLDPYRILGLMGEIEGGVQNYPESGKDWSMELDWDQSNYVRYENLIICCETTAAPTRTPSEFPSSMPTTDQPTAMPTDSPEVSDPTASPTTDSPSRTPSTEPTKAPTTDSPSRTPSTNPTSAPVISMPTVSPSTNPTANPTTDQPTVMPTAMPTTDQPSKYPTSEDPTTSPSGSPTVSPSGSPSAAPTDDCEHLLVGICYCEYVTGSEITCPESGAYMESDFNGIYSRTTEIKNGKPTYKNGYNWEIYWDDEVWVMFKPEEFFLYGEIIGGVQIYPESLKDWQYIDNGVVRIMEDLTICCSDNASPSRCPSVDPSTSPSVSPSESPSVDPTVSPSFQPSREPSPEPTISDPSVSPTVSPSKNPTNEEPTVSPTVNPSKSPERSVPTVSPTVTPSMPPTIPQPTVTPTQSPTTDQPTSTPTKAPTDDCVNFLVGEGCPCTNQDIVNYVILVDGSNSVDPSGFNAAKNAIADYLDTSGFPDSALVTVVEFSSGTPTEIVAPTLGSALSSSDLSSIRAMTPSGGTTMTQAAMEYVFDQYFTLENRQDFLVVVHGAEPSDGQDVCATMTKYDDADIVVKVVGIDSTVDTISDLSCTEPNNYEKEFYYNEYFSSDSSDIGSAIYSALVRNMEPDCAHGLYDTPYNGWYVRTEFIAEGRPVYRDPRNNNIAEFDSEVWTFHDLDGVLAPMAENEVGVQLYPETLRNWTYANPPDFPAYDRVVICCIDFEAPTGAPTVEPSNVPSSAPTTDEPTRAPVTSMPTVSPTKNPTTEQPTTSPTNVPTTDQPTVSPTKYPTTDQPSNSPTTDQPTQNPVTTQPTKNPTTDQPTAGPSTSPSAMPTTDQPTRSPVTSTPTSSPETSEPTVAPSAAPTKAPSTSRPTKAPSTSGPSLSPESQEPSTSPSDLPTAAPHTSMPSLAPNTRPPSTSDPTLVPTTDEPTFMPSTSPTTESPSTSPSNKPSTSPTVDPTRAPTLSPTDDCAHFTLTPCELQNVEEVDVLFIIDTSTSITEDDYTDFMFTLGQAVGQYFPDNDVAQLGLLQFASRPNERIPIQTGNAADWAAEIKVMDRAQGATWTKTAFQKGLEMWDEADTFEGRTRMTVLVTDGVPSYNQSPCDTIEEYRNQGIQIAVMGFGDAAETEDLLQPEFTCFSDLGYPTFAYPTFDSSVEAIRTIFGVINFCDLETTVFTPYGTSVSFSRYPAAVVNERPIYVSSEGWTFRWIGDGDLDEDGYWNLYDPANVYGYLNATAFSSQSFPITGMEWVYDNYTRSSDYSSTVRGDDSISYYNPVTIVCQDTATPTRTPSGIPSVEPTVSPSYVPSLSPTSEDPTVAPSARPTFAPTTTQPTVGPSDYPTGSPVTTEPTVSPSNSPTTDPSGTPSGSPVFSAPTTSPTVTPTANPTTEEPTLRPTVESPSVSPSTKPTVPPTGVPTVDSPTVTPSTSPSGTPSGTPTVSPPTGAPSVIPTFAPSRSPTECAIAVTACEEDCHARITALNETCTGRLSCDECFKEDVEEMAITVNELTESVTEYATCMTSSAQLDAVSDITTLLTDVSAMISSSNVQAWQDALNAAPGLIDCTFIPVEWCSFQQLPGGEICSPQNGECLPLANGRRN